MDYKDLYATLTEKLEKEIPITAYPIRELVQILRDKGNPITLKSKLTITKVFNSGDISGIVCTIDENEKDVFICSLSHLKFDPGFKFYNDIVDYQRKRVRRVDQLNRM
jgi:hypothetical protein